MIIERATEFDLEEVALLWEKAVLEIHSSYIPNKEWWKTRTQVFMNTPGIRYVMFVTRNNNNKVVGFVDGSIHPEPTTGLFHAIGHHLFVLPEYRGSIGGQLYKTFITYVLNFEDVKVMDAAVSLKSKSFWVKRNFEVFHYLIRRFV